MKLHKKRILAFLCAAVMLLSGCGKQDGSDPPGNSVIWEQMPTFTYGVMKSEKLSVLDWYSGRAEALSRAMLPNCVIESTLFYSVIENRTEGMTHKMEIFDGDQWRSVQLPEELHQLSDSQYLLYPQVTSDAVFFQIIDKNDYWLTALYRIDIREETWTAQLCQEIHAPA